MVVIFILNHYTKIDGQDHEQEGSESEAEIEIDHQVEIQSY